MIRLVASFASKHRQQQELPQADIQSDNRSDRVMTGAALQDAGSMPMYPAWHLSLQDLCSYAARVHAVCDALEACIQDAAPASATVGAGTAAGCRGGVGVRVQQHLCRLQQVSVHGLAAPHPEVRPHDPIRR